MVGGGEEVQHDIVDDDNESKDGEEVSVVRPCGKKLYRILETLMSVRQDGAKGLRFKEIVLKNSYIINFIICFCKKKTIYFYLNSITVNCSNYYFLNNIKNMF